MEDTEMHDAPEEENQQGEQGDNKEEGEKVGHLSGDFIFFPGPIRRLLTPVNIGGHVEDKADEENEEGGEDDEKDKEGGGGHGQGEGQQVGKEFDEKKHGEEEGDDVNRTSIPNNAEIQPHFSNVDHRTTSLGGLDGVMESLRSVRGSSEASTIRQGSKDVTARPESPFSARPTAFDPSIDAQPISLQTSRVPSFIPSQLKDWRYRDVKLPDPLPRTIGQWAQLEHKVRMIAPLPNAPKPDKVSRATVIEVRKRFNEMLVKDQKRVCDVVRKSWVPEEDEDFLTGNDKKSQQIAWENLSVQCVRNIRAMIEHVEYEEFAKELAEVNTWKAEDEDFRAVKADDNFYGVNWERKGCRGRFDWCDEDDLMYWHDQVWGKKQDADPEDVYQDIEGENPRPVRMQLKDGDEGVKLKNKKKKKAAAKPKLGQSKRGMLVGGHPGPWTFWTEPEEQHLRNVVLSAQGDAFGG
jgi:hypothetical protein